MRQFPGIRARLALLLAPSAAEARFNEEVRFHIDMESERLIREEGVSPEEADRRALIEPMAQEPTLVRVAKKL